MAVLNPSPISNPVLSLILSVRKYTKVRDRVIFRDSKYSVIKTSLAVMVCFLESQDRTEC